MAETTRACPRERSIARTWGGPSCGAHSGFSPRTSSPLPSSHRTKPAVTTYTRASRPGRRPLRGPILPPSLGVRLPWNLRPLGPNANGYMRSRASRIGRSPRSLLACTFRFGVYARPGGHPPRRCRPTPGSAYFHAGSGHVLFVGGCVGDPAVARAALGRTPSTGVFSGQPRGCASRARTAITSRLNQRGTYCWSVWLPQRSVRPSLRGARSGSRSRFR